MSKLKQLYVGHGSLVFYDNLVTDPDKRQAIFMSIIDRAKEVKETKKELKRKNNVYSKNTRQYFSTEGSKYDFIEKKQPKSDFTHLVAYKKDFIDYTNENGSEDIHMILYLYIQKGDKLDKILFDKLYKYSSVPLIEDWSEYLLKYFLQNHYLNQMNVDSIYDENNFAVYKLDIKNSDILSIVQSAIRKHEISINGCTENSSLMEMTDGLDSYLNIFGETLAERIQNSFTPKFIPGKDEYSEWTNNYDDNCFYNGIELFDAQKACIQASVNNLKTNNVTLLIAEMGSGSLMFHRNVSRETIAVLG